MEAAGVQCKLFASAKDPVNVRLERELSVEEDP
jgi:hypothetical protein